MSDALSVQERYAPTNACFGCGHANDKGLRIRSFERGDELVCEWRAQEHHQAFPGVLNGGIVGALLDCHSNWAAAMHFMRARGLDHPAPTVTAEYSVVLRRPTPLASPLTIIAKVTDVTGDLANVAARIESEGKITATCTGTFVAVKEGHPAFYRW